MPIIGWFNVLDSRVRLAALVFNPGTFMFELEFREFVL